MTVTEMVKNNLTSESLANYQNNDVKWRRVVSVSFSESKYEFRFCMITIKILIFMIRAFIKLLAC